MLRKLPFTLFSILLTIITLSSCVDSSTEDAEIEFEEESPDNKIIVIKDRLFSIPSPIQISMLIKENDIIFNEELLNPINNRKNYVTNLEKALNLGVYGADLGYLYLYENYPRAREYFAIVEDLSKNLGITRFVDEKTIDRLKANQNNRDSLLRITSLLFMKVDASLLDAERNEIAVLILTGGWIESLYFLTQIQRKEDEIIKQRIAEQKHPLDNLIEILRPYYGNMSEDYNDLLEELVELATIYDGIDLKYEYEEPVTKSDERITVINGTSSVIIDDFQLQRIIEKVSEIRSQVVIRN